MTATFALSLKFAIGDNDPAPDIPLRSSTQRRRAMEGKGPSLDQRSELPIGENSTSLVRVPMEFADSAEQALADLGRTEDIRFAPDNRRIAILGYTRETCLILDLEFVIRDSGPAINITDHIQIYSEALKEPHGLDFVDDTKLVVANRGGNIAFFNLPVQRGGKREFSLEPFRLVRKAGFRRRLHTPGSVCVVRNKANALCEILVCNNFKHRVTRHVVNVAGGRSLPRNRILLQSGLNLPDGITVSPDKRWIAVSSHETHSVLIYDNATKLTPKSEPAGYLAGMEYPHGLRFSPDGRHLFVADAGEPYIHLFKSDNFNWAGDRNAVRKMQAMSETSFLKGRTSPREGGPKGIDIDKGSRFLAITCEEQPLAFFFVRDLLL